jgi:hypothetical protein
MRDVLVRGFAGEPVILEAVEADNGLIFVVHPDSVGRLAAGMTDRVGIPEQDVFELDETVFSAVAEQWAHQRTTDFATWQKLRRFRIRI